MEAKQVICSIHPSRDMFHAFAPLLLMVAADARHRIFSDANFRGRVQTCLWVCIWKLPSKKVMIPTISSVSHKLCFIEKVFRLLSINPARSSLPNLSQLCHNELIWLCAGLILARSPVNQMGTHANKKQKVCHSLRRWV